MKMIRLLLASALAFMCGAVSARTMYVTSFTDTTVSLAFGEPDGKAYSLCIGYGTTDGGTDKYAWTSFAKDVATVAADDTAKTITLPAAAQAAGTKYRLFLLQTTDLPYEQELEYIESTDGGNQYIDSGIIGRDGTGMECDVAYTLSSNVDRTLIGARKDTNHTRFFLTHVCYGHWGMGHFGFKDGSVSHVQNQKVHLVAQAKAGSQTLKVDGVSSVSTTDADALDTGFSMYIFAANLYGSVKQQLAARLYNMKITQDGELVRQYYPVELSNGDGALYDEVTGTVFANKNTSNKFTLGAARTDRFGIVKATATVAAVKAEITFSGYQGSETLTDFPALIRLPSGVTGFTYTMCAADGSDIYFRDADGNVLAAEIDTWNTSGESLVWVRVPTLTKMTKITMYWGQSGAKPAASATTAWQNYIGVWHMNKASGASGAIVKEPNKASTGSGFDLTPTKCDSGTDAKLSQVQVKTGGPVGSCVQNQSENGKYNRLLSGTGIMSKQSNASKFTVSGWVKMTTKNSGAAVRLWAVKNAYNDSTGWEVQVNKNESSWVSARGSSGTGVGVGMGDFQANWKLLTFVYNGTTVTAYADGEKKGSGTIASVATRSEAFAVGSNSNGSENGFCGCFDEVRYYNGTLSADRVQADYDTVKVSNFAVASAVVPVREIVTWQGAAGDDWWGVGKWLFQGVSTTFESGDKALFNGTSGQESVVVSSKTVTGGVIAENDVSITGTADLSAPTIDVAVGKTARVSANLIGAVAKDGAGTLALGGAPTATVSVNAGTLALADTGNYGAATVNLAGGTTLGADGAAATVALKSFMPASGATLGEGLTLSSDDTYSDSAFNGKTINVNGKWILKTNGVKDNVNKFIAFKGVTLKGTGTLVSESFGMSGNSSCTFEGVTLLPTSQWVFGRTWGTLNFSDVTLRMVNPGASNYYTMESGKYKITDDKTLTVDTRNATDETQTCNYTMHGDASHCSFLASSGKLRKIGGGTLSFDFNLLWTGASTVEGGTLALNADCAAPLTVGSTATGYADEATLKVNGSRTFSATDGLTFGNDSCFDLQDGAVGTVTLAGKLAVSDDTTFKFDISGATCDTLAFTGDDGLQIAEGKTITLEYSFTDPVADVPYVLTSGAKLTGLAATIRNCVKTTDGNNLKACYAVNADGELTVTFRKPGLIFLLAFNRATPLF